MGTFQEQYKEFDGFYSKIVQEMESKKKSPYELDLEVMDRRPDITPKVGDWVKIKSKEWYEKWKDSSGTVNVCFAFTGEMKELCGRIEKVTCTPSSKNFYLDGIGYTWSMEMFEQVYPSEEYIVYKSIFGEIVTPITKGSTAMEAVQNKGQSISVAIPNLMPYLRDITTTKETANWPNILPGILQPGKERSESERRKLLEHLRNKWEIGEESETKLRIIKTNQLIKIDKL